MSGYDSLAEFVGNRANHQQIEWRNLMGQCDGAKRKLAQLGQYAERYRAQMGGQLGAGMDATATMGFLRFIAQIETVIGKQEIEVARLEQACREQWHRVVEARREKRMYEILRDKAAAEKLGAALRRAQAEIDELTGRIVKLL
ncbi:MAG TPA: flagellar export protein FliJ [Stellaceae bacterium]|nr:flagellar export protein FliJ [Stellaceae bacterium]